MSKGPGRGALIGALVVILAIAIGVLLMTSERGGSEPPAHSVSKPAEPASESEGFKANDSAPVALPVPTSGNPESPLADANKRTPRLAPVEMPVVAHGHVQWAGGTLPPEGVDVELYDADGSSLDSTTTEPDGAYELRWDEPLAKGWSVGTDSLLITVGSDMLELAPDNGGALPVHVPGEPPVEVNFSLGFAPVLTGRVTDRITGAPIAMADVSAVSTLQASMLESCDALTDADGNYSIELEELPLHGLIVWCRADDHQAQLAGPQDVAPAAKAGDALHFDFALDPAVAWRGKVVSATSGEPVEDATITIGSDFEAFSDEFDFEVTDENGEFTLDLPYVPAQGAWVHVQADEYSPAGVRGVQPGKDFVIKLSPAVTLVGQVTINGKDPPARPADVQVFFDGETFWGDNGLYDQAYTDPAGHFSVLLEYAPPDEAKLKIDAIGCAPWEGLLKDVARPAGNGQLEVSVQLMPAP